MKIWEHGQISFGGFPRSGNHALGFTLTNAFPNRKVVWLRHRISDLSTAPNCAVAVRNPLESVSSWIECNQDERTNAVDRILDWYLRYMTGVLENKERLAIFSLKDISENPYACSVVFSNRFNLEKPLEVTSGEVNEWLIKNMPTNFLSPITINKEKWYNLVQNSHLYEKANTLYGEISLIAKMGTGSIIV